MYHVFFNHLSADGHLGCFHVLALVNSAAVNLRVHVSLQIKSFLWIYAQESDCRIIYRLALILLEEMKKFQKTKTQTSERALPFKKIF